MIVVLARVETDPEDVAALRDVIREMETDSRAEAGCHDYTFSQEISDPQRVRITERWESMEALQAHFATPHMTKFNAALAARPPRSMELEIYELGEKLALPG